MCLIVADGIGHRHGREDDEAMKAFRLDELEAERAANEGAYLQFLRERNMSVGLYALDAGEHDPQKPHNQDEVYFVVSGRAAITVGLETTEVARGQRRVRAGRRGPQVPPHQRGPAGARGVLSAGELTCRLGVPGFRFPGFPRGPVRGGQGLRGPRRAPCRP
ncbi:hypothetical protein GCM10020295_42210 [Streptomyces cinereospinus]